MVVVEELGRGDHARARSCRRWSPARSSPPRATGRSKQRLAARPRRRLTRRRGRARRRRRASRRHRQRHRPTRCSGRARRPDPRPGRRRRRRRRCVGRRRHGRRPRQPRPDPTRRRGSRFDGAAADGRSPARGRRSSTSPATILRAEATGIARECTEQAAAYAKEREQFGRPIAMFQAVKHHCANMLVATELATAAVWDAARAARRRRRPVLAAPRRSPRRSPSRRRPVRQPQHPGARRHRLHLGARRPPLPAPGHRARGRDRARGRGDRDHRSDPRRASSANAPSTCRPRPRRSGRRCARSPQRSRTSTPTPSAPRSSRPATSCRTGPSRGAVPRAPSSSSSSSRSSRRPGIKRPQYGITGWVILTLIQHATDDQVARWVPPGAHPGGHLVPAVQRARRRLRCGGRQDPRHPGRRRLAPQRPEGVDQRRPRGRQRPGHRAHRPGRPEAQRASPRWSSTCTPKASRYAR